MKNSLKGLGLLTALGRFFGLGGSRSNRSYSNMRTNHRLPKAVQNEIIAKAQAKRERKMARPQGWYNG